MTADLLDKLNRRAPSARAATATPAAALASASVPTSASALARTAEASATLRAREAEWWQRYAVLEDRYFWVLPDAVQPPSRTRYLGRIAAQLQGATRVVDYGCGRGWIARAIATQLDADVIGLDFAPAQIELARAANADVARLSFAQIDGPADLPRADAYIFHGLLHHLPSGEIDALFANLAARAAPGARLVIVEPTCFPGRAPDARDRVLLDEIESLVQAPRRMRADAGIAELAAIEAIRAETEARWWGELPYGPSPMEKPFEHTELARYVGDRCTLSSSELVQFLPASQALAGELAMLAESAPALATEIGPYLQDRMDLLERVLLKFPQPPDAGWYMNMLTARVG